MTSRDLPSDNYVVTGGSCVRACGGGFHEVEENGVHRCKECEGPCPKGRQQVTEATEVTEVRLDQCTLTAPLSLSAACDGLGVGALVNTIAINASNIESFRNCTKINGDVSILGISFKG